MPRRHITQWLCAAFCFHFLSPIQAEPLPQTRLQIGLHLVKAEVAATPESRSLGLMHRPHLGKNEGMLFIFDAADIQAMWMRNTPLPLSVAFIDDTGAVINIAEMRPLVDNIYASSSPARYALEMNAGWFAQHGVEPGTKIKGLPR